MESESHKAYGLVAEFETPADIMSAARQVRNRGFTKWDVHTPYPIHGMDQAMGMNNSKVGWFTFLGGIIGFTTGYLMIWFMNAFDYPLIVGGKPMFSPYFAFPVGYELTILLGAFGTLFGMFSLNKLPRLHHPLLKYRNFAKVTHDRYFLVIEVEDPKFNEGQIRELLTENGSTNIELVEE